MKPGKPLKRTPLKRKSKSPTARAKDRIQKLLTKIVRLRDDGCVFKDKGVGHCSQLTMADHIIGRSISRVYWMVENVVCICWYHHNFWKKKNPTLYTEIVKERIGQETYNLIHELKDEIAHYKLVDWMEIEESLKKELENLR